MVDPDVSGLAPRQWSRWVSRRDACIPCGWDRFFGFHYRNRRSQEHAHDLLAVSDSSETDFRVLFQQV